MLAGRTLAVVLAGQDHRPLPPVAGRGGAGGELGVGRGEDEARDLLDVGAQREDLGAGGHDRVGGDVVADREADSGAERLRERFTSQR